MHEHKMMVIEDGIATVKFDVNNLDLEECFDLAFLNKDAYEEFIKFLFWSFFELSQGYGIVKNREHDEAILPITYSFDSNVWFIDIGFFMEMIGKFIDEKLQTSDDKLYYDVAERAMTENGSVKLLQYILIGKFEFDAEIIKQNKFAMYIKKGKRLSIEPKFYAKKVIEKTMKNGDIVKYVSNVVPIIASKIQHLNDRNLVNDLLEVQSKLEQKILKDSVYVHIENCKNEMKTIEYYEYVYGDYDKFAEKM